jgi:hypothetical protein
MLRQNSAVCRFDCLVLIFALHERKAVDIGHRKRRLGKMKRLFFLFVGAVFLAACSSPYVGKRVLINSSPISDRSLPYSMQDCSIYGVFNTVLSKNGEEYCIDGTVDWTHDEKCHHIHNSRIIFFLVNGETVVDTVTCTLSGRKTDTLRYHRTFTTDVSFDGLALGKWSFMYRPE